MGNRNLNNDDVHRNTDDFEIERERERRDNAWSPASRSQYRARDVYQDVQQSRGFYEQPRERRLRGGMRSEEEFYASKMAEAGNRRIPSSGGGEGTRSDNYSLGHRGKGPKNYARSDERIREIICDRFYDDDRLDASGIDVNVAQGEVTLTGEVRDRGSKRRAEDMAEQCAGVSDVHNQLRIDNGRPT